MDCSPEAEPSCAGAGVEAASEALSLVSDILNVGTSTFAGAGEDAEEGVDFVSSFLTGALSKRLSNSGDSLKVITLEVFLDLSDREVAIEGDRVVVVVVVVDMKFF